MNSCPSRDELRQLLASELAGDMEQPLMAHVETCNLCQQVLEELTVVQAGPLPDAHALDSGQRAWKGLRPDGEVGPRREPASNEFAPPRPQSKRKLSDDQLHRLRSLLRPGSSAPAADGSKVGLPAPAAYPAIPGYEILRELGHGGMAVVYEARQLRLNRRVALKMIRAGELATPEQLVRFCSEGETIARLRHPHIVQIYEVGTYNQQPYLALELMEGGSLAEAQSGQPLPARLAAEVVETLARAMHYTHRQGIVHRDLNPANILLESAVRTPKSVAEHGPLASTDYGRRTTDYGLLKISDFGLAKHLDKGSRRTKTGYVLGTPSYMAPEQVRGENNRIGPVTDVYALGAILYELLTGRPPFEGPNSHAILKQVTDFDPVPPSRRLSQVPRELDVICLKCLEKESARRYATAEALASDLRRFLDGEPIQARRVHTLERAWRWAKRRPSVAGLLLALLVALLVGTGASTYFAIQSGNHAALAQRKQSQATLAQAPAKPVPPHATAVKFKKALLGHTGGVVSVAYAPDGRLLASGDLSGEVRVWNVPSGTLRYALPVFGDAVYGLAFSPDGKFLLTTLERGIGDIAVWDAETGRSAGMLKGHTRKLFEISFDRDGKTLVSGGWDATIRVWDFATRSQLRVIPSPDGQWIRSVVVSASGKIAVGTGQNTFILEPDGQLIKTLKTCAGPLCFSPDGRLLAGTTWDLGRVTIWEVKTAEQVASWRAHQGLANGVAFSGDGRVLATAGGDDAIRLWDVATQRQLAELPHDGHPYQLAFSPDGATLATTGREDRLIKLWDVAFLRSLNIPDKDN